MNRLIYDCEIIKAIPTKDSRIEGIEYCKGWTDYEGMGISVIGWKVNNQAARVSFSGWQFLEFLDFFCALSENPKIVGFNSKNFDDKLLAANDLEGIETHYDILEEVRIAAGFGPGFRSVPKGYSYKLDAIAQANGMAKTGHGALAPVLWQQGKQQEVIDYCKNDVDITSAILDLGLAGELIDPNTGNKLQLAAL